MAVWYTKMGREYFRAKFNSHPHKQWQTLAHFYPYKG